MSDAKHPMQPIELVDGIARFKKNKLVRFLIDQYGLNQLHMRCSDATQDDWNQLAQLIGYSVSGFGDLSYADHETVAKADKIAESLTTATEQKPK